MTQGHKTVTFFCNDTLDNINSTTRQFTVDSVLPVLLISTPTNNTNTSTSTLDVKYTYTETNCKNVTWNDGSGANTTLASCGTNITTPTWSMGKHNITVFMRDWSNNLGKKWVSFTIDTSAPDINLTTPLDNLNTTDTTQNMTSVISDNQGIKNATLNIYNLTSGNLINTTTINFGSAVVTKTLGVMHTFTDGFYKWFYKVYDWASNFDISNNNTIRIDTTAPTFTDFDNQSIYDNQSLSYDINATDSGVGLGTFSINWTTVFTINRTTGLLINSSSLSEGNYYINVSINDTLGNTASDIMWINVTATDSFAPVIIKSSPINYANLSSGANVYFNFTATDDSEIDTCQLWTNTTGTWKKNYTWVNPNSGSMNFTTLHIHEGISKWNIWCNDSYDNSNFSISNYTLTIDETKPNMTISNTNNSLEPAGDLTVKVNYTASDTYIRSCYYTLRNLAGALHNYPENTSINCAATSIQISSLYFGTFVVQFWGEDYAGNLDDYNFTFRTWAEGGSGGGGGGGQQYDMDLKLNITLKVRYYNNGLEYIMDDINQYNLSNLTYDAISIDIVGENKGDYNLDLSLLNITPLEFNKSVPKKLESLKVEEKKTLWASELMLVNNFTEKENYTFFVNVKGKNGILKVYSNDTVKLSFVKVVPKTFWTKVGDLVWETNPLAGILTFISIGGYYYYSIIKKKRKKKDEIKEE
jgi:hypothetical protein